MANTRSPGKPLTKKPTKKNTKSKQKNPVEVATPIDILSRKKAKPVKSDKQKIKALADLKMVREKIDTLQKRNDKRYKVQDKLYNQSQTLREKLGID